LKLTLSDSVFTAEGYELDIVTDTISITAGTAAGLFYGIQTLCQLLPTEFAGKKVQPKVDWVVPEVSIQDHPAFEKRGFMLRVYERPHNAQKVRQILDLMAGMKLNHFYYDLKDTLTTQDATEMFNYAQERFIKVDLLDSSIGKGVRENNFYTVELTQEIEILYAMRDTLVAEIYRKWPIVAGIRQKEDIRARLILASDDEWAELTYKILPRLFPIAEMAWSPYKQIDLEGFVHRLDEQLHRLDQQGICYAQSASSLSLAFKEKRNKINVRLKTGIENAEIYFTLNGSKPSSDDSFKYDPLKPLTLMNDGTVQEDSSWVLFRYLKSPLSLKKSTIVKAAVFYQEHRVSLIKEQEIIIVE